MKWYVFDEFDCFDSFDSVIEAATHADSLAKKEELKGVHIVYMTEAQFKAYCTHGDLRLSFLS